MDWLEDDEMMMQWEDVSKEEENVTMRSGEGRAMKADGVLNVPCGADGVTRADQEEGSKKGEGNEEGGW